MSRPEAVIFDYGCVLSLPQEPDGIERMAAFFPVPLADFERAYWALRLDYDRGDFDGIHYWAQLGERLGRGVSQDQARELIDIDNRSWAHPNDTMVEAARRLRSNGIRQAILSNMPIDFRRYLPLGVRWLPEFDQHTYSCELRTVKPDVPIYEHCLDGLGLAPEQTVFIDDRLPNIEAAKKLGINTILFDCTENVITGLEQLFRMDL